VAALFVTASLASNDIHKVEAILGHRKIDTTKSYARNNIKAAEIDSVMSQIKCKRHEEITFQYVFKVPKNTEKKKPGGQKKQIK
jgi:hypothetical protein